MQSGSDQDVISLNPGAVRPQSQLSQNVDYDAGQNSNLYYRLQQDGYGFLDPHTQDNIPSSALLAQKQQMQRGNVGRAFSFKSGTSLGEMRDGSEGGSITTGSGVTLDRQQTQILGAKRPKPHKVWRQRYVKILVVGDSGFGKTSLRRAYP
eukprot:TRINITY_DN4311_c0_g1_i8.p1 TRINITY_DN4311_c0_g1~~TRINITY_DN4311_c0_g1_i8.p1  ORF type:complete len:151 (-),score=17.68 TRINITY_DN4311_c0_g1_i8:65-517(-)